MSESPEVTKRLDRARVAMSAGNMPEADRICAEILQIDPDCAGAHLVRGVLASRSRRLADANLHLTRAHELEPDSFETALALAVARRMSGDLATATNFAELAVRLNPDHFMARAELGGCYLDASRLVEAETHLKVAARLAPQDVRTLLTLNQCLEREGKGLEARQVMRRVLDSGRIPPEELLRLTPIMLSQGNPRAAAECGREALKRNSTRLRAWAQLARSLVEANRGAEANELVNEPGWARSLRAESADSEALAVAGTAYQSLGRVEEARDCFRRALEAPNPPALAFYAYTHSRRMGDEDRETMRAMEARLAGRLVEPAEAVYLHFALGKSYEDLGEYSAAMAHYESANDRGRSARSVPAPFDRAKLTRTVDCVIAMFSREFVATQAADGSPSELPVLVVGMIRSGTTLVEQILSSHSHIGGAGEVPFWANNRLDVADIGQAVLHSERLADATTRYLALLSSISPDKSRVVDKMPGNYEMLGLIHMALPRARIIHMRRRPIDNCISIYTTHNRAGTEFGDKSAIVCSYREYRRLMAHWREILPRDRFLDVDYEDLVVDSEPTIRRMIGFCGLEWEEACLRPEDNPQAVTTPSLWQVRRAINSSSVERWRRFEPWLGEFRELLDNSTSP